MAEVETLLTLQMLVVQALRSADRAGLHAVGISLDNARLQLATLLQEAGQADAIEAVMPPNPG